MKAIYLKINRQEKYTYRNLKCWLDILSFFPEYRVYLLCDNQALIEQVKTEIDIEWDKIEVIQSCRDNERLKYIVQNVANEHWQNAGYAHLTTFLHAKENQFDAFWNIDADDTVFCLPAEQTAQILRNVEKYSEADDEFGAIGLDMWVTFTKALHWSLGITYINGNVEWIKIMMDHCQDTKFKENYIKKIQPQNVDGYLSYLKDFVMDNGEFKTFYVDGLRFIHYADDFFKRPLSSGMFYWKDGYMILPILYYCFDDKVCGKIKIPSEIVRIDMPVSEEGFRTFMDLYPMEDIKMKREWLR